MEERPLLVLPEPELAKKESRSGGKSGLAFPPHERQVERLSPQFEELQHAFDARLVSLQMDPVGAVPEQVLVLETIGTITEFVRAVERVPGMEWMVEWYDEPIAQDEDFHRTSKQSETPLDRRLFLIMSNAQAMKQLLSLWKKYEQDPKCALDYGLGRFRSVFRQLREIRFWGVQDRLYETGILEDWRERVKEGQETVSFEIELWYRGDIGARKAAERRLKALLEREKGRVVSQACIEEIAYHAVLAELPIDAVKAILEHPDTKLVLCDDIMFFRPIPQAAVTISTDKIFEEPLHYDLSVKSVGKPIVALLDGLPLQKHQLLDGRLIIDDPDGYAEDYPASERVHGTAIASLILHGDLHDEKSSSLRHPLYVRPILRPDVRYWTKPRPEAVPRDVLLVDLVHRAIRRLFEGEGDIEPVAPTVCIVNLSLGDERRPFFYNVSPLARLLDYLAYRYNILFIVSAGNHTGSIGVPIEGVESLSNCLDKLQDPIIRSINAEARLRRLLSPAEAINAITVASVHDDLSNPPSSSELHFDPYAATGLPSPFNALGLGFRGAVKPDILHIGGRQFFRVKSNEPGRQVVFDLIRTAGPPGLKVASPGQQGSLSGVCYFRGTSASAALATRAAAQLYDVVLDLKQQEGTEILDEEYIPVLIKALLVHSASWGNAYQRLSSALQGCTGFKSLREHLVRFLGYGRISLDRVMHCTSQRATLLGCGRLSDGQAHVYSVPLPPSLSGKPVWRRLILTLAYFSPVDPRSSAYRCFDVWVEPPHDTLQVERQEVSGSMTQRGTVQHEVMTSNRTTVFTDDSVLKVKVNCRRQSNTRCLDRDVRYGVVITLEVAEDVEIQVYDEIRSRIRPKVAIVTTDSTDLVEES